MGLIRTIAEQIGYILVSIQTSILKYYTTVYEKIIVFISKGESQIGFFIFLFKYSKTLDA